MVRVQDPRTVLQVLGGTLIMGAILYVVVDQVLDTNNVSGGLWDVGKFLISVIPTTFAIMYIFG